MGSSNSDPDFWTSWSCKFFELAYIDLHVLYVLYTVSENNLFGDLFCIRYVFVVFLSEPSSGWCLSSCPLWCGSSLFRSVTRKMLLSRKASSSLELCCLWCCRKPSALLIISCWSKLQFTIITSRVSLWCLSLKRAKWKHEMLCL